MQTKEQRRATYQRHRERITSARRARYTAEQIDYERARAKRFLRKMLGAQR